MKSLICFFAFALVARAASALPGGRVLDVDIRSEGCSDLNKLGPGCGWAFIKVNGKDLSPHKRGHNVVILDAETGGVLEIKSFDTHGDPEAGYALADFLRKQHGRHRIVLVAIQDDGSIFSILDAHDELKKLGTGKESFRIDYRGSLAFVGYAGNGPKPSWITMDQSYSGSGPSVVKTKIPLTRSQ